MFHQEIKMPCEMFRQEIKNPMEWFQKRIGTSGVGGQFYERELAMLMLLQGVTKKRNGEIEQFSLATNMEKLGNFDDIAFKYKYLDDSGEEKSKVIFLQAKHKTNPLNEKELITFNKLISDSDQKGSFALREYFSSFIEIKKRFNEKHERNSLFEGEFQDCDFVIYTNALPHENITNEGSVLRLIDANEDYVLNLDGNCSYYQLVYGGNKDHDRKIKDVLESSSNCKQLAKVLVRAFFPSSSDKCAELKYETVIKKYHWCLKEKIIEIVEPGKGELKDSFLDDGSLSVEDKIFKDAFFLEMSKMKKHVGIPTENLKAILRENIINIPKHFDDVTGTNEGLTLPADSVSEQDIEEFLRNLKLFLGQPNYTELRESIKNKIQERYEVISKVDVENIFSKVNSYVEQWWTAEKSSYYLTEMFDYFHHEKVFLDKLKCPPAVNLPQLWHVPPQNDHFVGRRALLDRLNDLLNSNMVTHIAACHGLGGVGKTQLALQFAWNNLNNYNGIIWLDATDRNTFVNEYIALGHDLNIIRDDEENKSIKILVMRLKIWLEDPKRTGWLMICDNTPDYKEVADLLPTRGGKILFTSRYDFALFKSKNVIKVDVFDPSEARNLVQSILDVDGQSMDLLLVDELSKTLGHLPLAIAQASAYIKQTEIAIDSYLKYYENRKQAFLSSDVLLKTCPAGCNPESAGIAYVTWDITTTKIQKISTLAANWLTVCAYLNSNDIPFNLLNLFSRVPENNPSSEIYEAALGTLKSYSMLNTNRQLKTMSVHKLVQEVTLMKSKEKEETENDLSRALFMIRMDIFKNPRFAVDHAISVWKHSCKILSLKTQFCLISPYIILTLSTQARYKEAFLFGSEAIELLQEIMGPSHDSVIVSINFTAQILTEQNRFQEAFNFYKDIFEKRSQVMGPNHKLTLTAYMGMATALEMQGKDDEAQEILTSILEKIDRDFEDNCFEILHIKYLLAIIFVKKDKLMDALRIRGEICKERNYYNNTLYSESKFQSIKFLEASIFDRMGKFDEAITVFEEILNYIQHSVGLYHPYAFELKRFIGMELIKKGDCEKASEYFKDVIDIVSSPDVLGPENPTTLEFISIQASILYTQGFIEESLKAYKEVVEKFMQIFGCYHFCTIRAKLNMAGALQEQGNDYESLKMFSENIEYLLDICEPVHPLTITAKKNKAVLLMNMGKRYKNTSYFSDALQIHAEVYDMKNKYDPFHRSTLITRNHMGYCHGVLGNYSEALKMFQEVQEIAENCGALNRGTILGVKFNMLFCLKNLGKHDEAFQLHKEIAEERTEISGSTHPDAAENMCDNDLTEFCKWEDFSL